MAHTPAEKREEAIFEIVNQLNRGAALITSRDEREQLAELNLIAGRRAKASTAYASALSLSRRRRGPVGGRLLGAPARAHLRAGAAPGRMRVPDRRTGGAEERLTMLSSRAATTVDRATVACLRVDLYTTLDRSDRAVDVCLDYLRHLGVDWSPHPTEEEVRREYERIWSQLGSRAIEELIDLPLMSDPASLATLDVLTKVVPPALFTDANLLSPGHLPDGQSQPRARQQRRIVLRLCVAWRHAGPHFGDYEAGFRFGQLGYELVEKRGLEALPGQDLHGLRQSSSCPGRDMSGPAAICCAAPSRPQTRPAISPLRPTAAIDLNTNLLAAGDPLVEVQRKPRMGSTLRRRCGSVSSSTSSPRSSG